MTSTFLIEDKSTIFIHLTYDGCKAKQIGCKAKKFWFEHLPEIKGQIEITL